MIVKLRRINSQLLFTLLGHLTLPQMNTACTGEEAQFIPMGENNRKSKKN